MPRTAYRAHHQTLIHLSLIGVIKIWVYVLTGRGNPENIARDHTLSREAVTIEKITLIVSVLYLTYRLITHLT